jgi:flagellar P-ring protein precursor FlgI
MLIRTKSWACAAAVLLFVCLGGAARAQYGDLFPYDGSLGLPGPSAGGTTVRIKDIAKIEGVRDNQLVGFGVIVGLAGTGDGVNMTRLAVQNMMERFGIIMNANDINVDNMAAVMVTASLPAFARPGDTLDVTVSSIGDADSLRGGTLLQTPLKGADGQVYAVAQGSLSIGGYSESTGGARSTKGFPTAGRVPGGAIVEREVPSEIMRNNTIFVSLNDADFTTAARAQNAVNRACKSKSWAEAWGYCPGVQEYNKSCSSCRCCEATAVDGGTIKIEAPGVAESQVVSFIADVERIEITQDTPAKIVINERTGTIVMGYDVKVDTVNIAHGSVVVNVYPRYQVSQPPPLSEGGQTVLMPMPDIIVEEKKVPFYKVNVGDIVRALNDMGVTPSDVIAILQALKVSSALQAEIVTM